ncbi:hypothetical protein ACIP5Y_00350 [Nocardia sp. NPDC088792]|uniref:hypothetical protein n=1 Tax=Nocardia sp. NPDC088792 TaxID=3364332 RepID=UPI0038281F0A
MSGTAADDLKREIMQSPEIDRQWIRLFDAADIVGIAEARSAGRKAGRSLKMKVATFHTDPRRRADGLVAVIVTMNQEENDPEEEQRMWKRTLNRPGFGAAQIACCRSVSPPSSWAKLVSVQSCAMIDR